MVEVLKNADSENVFQYQTPSGGWLPSTLYTWSDMIEGVKIMATTGIGKQKLYVGEGDNYVYGLVNLAAFLGESMKETIMYNACDENNWSDPKYVQQVGGVAYGAASSCGQGKQSYQDYKCSKDDDDIAGGKMACDYDPNMEMRAHSMCRILEPSTRPYSTPPSFECLHCPRPPALLTRSHECPCG
eukprot:7385550-Prymnesium_polylepis.1